MTEGTSTFAWRPSYSVGNFEIDNQHRQLVHIIDSLHGMIQARSASGSLAGLLEELTEYTHTHFLHEERMMILNGYPNALPHRKEHDRMRKVVEDFHKELKAGKPVAGIRLMSILKDWLIRHIQATDRELGHFLAMKHPKAN